MPRSGTSFTASALQSAGLHIGRQLMAPGHGNVKGFFEDLDIVHFHEAVLRSQGIHQVGWTLENNIEVNEQYTQKAKELVASYEDTSLVWGWKDPRTTLFLDFWAEMLPNAHFLLIYRAPWEVVDSIYRRGDDVFFDKPELAVQIWMHYNRKILDFYNTYTNRCLLVSVYSMSAQPHACIEAINEKFNVSLKMPATDIYEQSLLHTQVSTSHRPALITHFYPEALQIYQELNTKELPLPQVKSHTLVDHLQTDPADRSVFQDWLHIRRLEGKVKSLRSELEQIKTELQQTQEELEEASSNTNIRSFGR
jgi:hypothetical protein